MNHFRCNFPPDVHVAVSPEAVDDVLDITESATMLPPPTRTGSTVPSSREPTLLAPATVEYRERVWTRRLAYAAIGLCVGDGLIHVLAWAVAQ